MRAAAKALRREGYAGTRVADVMKAAGLTHGGFYAHFPSREAMLAEALDQAGSEAVESLLGAAVVKATATGTSTLEALVEGYLSDVHVAATETGCTLAALGSETRRQGPEIRRVATRRLKELVRMLGAQAATHPGAAEPMAALSAMVGALLISRVVDEPALAKQVRASATRLVLGKPPRKP